MPDTSRQTKQTPAPATRQRKKTPSAEKVAQTYFDAFIARDPDAMAAHWSEEGVEDIAPLGIFRGPEEVRALFRELFAAMPDSDASVTRITADGGRAVVEWRFEATFSGTGSFQGVEPNGRRIQLRGVDCLDVEKGKIVRNTVYYDGMAFARGLGMMPPLDSPAERAMKRVFNGVTRARKRLGR